MTVMYTQKKPIDNVHVVRERDRQRFRELLAVFSLGVPIGLFLLLFTWQNLEVIRLGREATQLQKQRKDIDEDNKRLHVELDRLTALESVQRRATDMGFTETQAGAIVMTTPAGDARRLAVSDDRLLAEPALVPAPPSAAGAAANRPPSGGASR